MVFQRYFSTSSDKLNVISIVVEESTACALF
jgi:hypothetical protein